MIADEAEFRECRIAVLTQQLKQMSGDEAHHAALWDERADLIRERRNNAQLI